MAQIPSAESEVAPINSNVDEILSGRSNKSFFRRILPFFGPAFIASVAYVDPGNFATNIQGGAKFGYMLLWVIVLSNLMAMLLQSLSAKLGIATGQNLAEVMRSHFPRRAALAMWGLMELVAMATDLAEFLGATVGLNLLFGLPLWLSAILTTIITVFILALERHGFRPLEAVITGFVGIIALSYVVETILDRPNLSQVLHGAITPQLNGAESVLLATGIIGATVMPHALFLHSALMQNRIVTTSPEQKRKLYHFELIDVGVAMTVAGFVNAAMLIMAASTFFFSGHNDVGTLEQAHQTLQPLLGHAASTVFGISLLASGLSSSSVGTMAGQVIMQGFLHRHIPVWLRRTVTIAPSLIVIFLGLDPTRTLVISQVMLSFGLPFAVVPLVAFTARRDIMGILVNHRITTIVASVIAAIIIFLNLLLLYQTFFGS
jgi:manganese transport protein